MNETKNMSCIDILEKVNRNINKLLRTNEQKWISQRDKLKKLLELNKLLLNKYSLQKPNARTLQFIEVLKQWRTEELNAEENMNDPRYGDDIASLMSQLKVKIMIEVIPNMINN